MSIRRNNKWILNEQTTDSERHQVFENQNTDYYNIRLLLYCFRTVRVH